MHRSHSFALLAVELLFCPVALAQVWHRLTPVGSSFDVLAMCQDTARNRTVLFTGRGAGPWSGTWEYDGGRWRQVVTGRSPSPRGAAAMAFDSGRGRVVLFGGVGANGSGPLLGDTWEFDGVSWTPVTTATLPPARSEHAMAFDPAHGVVMHGGTDAVSTLGDTWAFDGSDWSPIATGLPRRAAAMTYDPIRGMLLMFGGLSTTGYPRELLVLQGSSWQVLSSSGPPGRLGHAMVFDSAAQMAVVFGGHANISPVAAGSWGWTGSGWFLLTSTGPPASWSTAAAFDPQRNRTICAIPDAGLDTWTFDLGHLRWTHEQSTPVANVTSSLAYDWNRDIAVLAGNGPETWEWSDGAWRVRQTPTPAPERTYPGVCYDILRGRTVVFGGEDPNHVLTNTTWVYDGVDWRLVNTPSSPSPRSAVAMCSSPNTVLMFGGAVGETWEFNGVTWTQRLVAGPPPRAEPCMAFDLARNRAVLFGGEDMSGPRNDTWEWDGQQWHAVTTAHSPPARYGAGFAYDAARQLVVMNSGGFYSYPLHVWTMYQDTWQYDGSDWTAVAMPFGSPRQLRSGVTADPRGRILSFGGMLGAEFWELRPSPVKPSAIGIGCLGSNGELMLTSPDAMPAVLGTTFGLAIDNLPIAPGVAALVLGYDLQQWNGAPLPVDLTPLGLTGCSAFVSVDDIRLLAHNGGRARWTVDLPDTPQLVGLVAGAQALAFDTSAPSGVGSVSNGLRIELR